MAASADTTATTGISQWELYNATATAGAKQAYELVARDASGNRLRAVHFQTISEKVLKGKKPSEMAPTAAYALVDRHGNILNNTLTSDTSAFVAHLGHDRNAALTKQQYGCYGDILWAAGGLIATVGACAAVVPGAATGPADGVVVAACVGAFVGGLSAGVVSAVEDCSPLWNPPTPQQQPDPDVDDPDDDDWDSYETDIEFWDDGGWSDWGY